MLDDTAIQTALGLAPPWQLAHVTLEPDRRRLHLGLTYDPEGAFVCPRCGNACEAELDWPRTWRHADFMGHVTYLHTRLPDLGCERCGIVPADARWEQPTVGFALLTIEQAKSLVP